MKSIKKYSGILLTVLLCVVLSLMMTMTASAALVVGEEPGNNNTVDVDDNLDEDTTETPPEEDPTTSTNEEEPTTSTEDNESDAEPTESEEDYTSTESEEESEVPSEEYNEGDESYYEEEHETQGTGNYGNGEDITGVIGTGDEEWGANYSEGTVVSATGSTAKKNIADYHSKMMSLIWIPIVLIVLAVGTLIVVNVYYTKKKGKKGKKAATENSKEE